MFWLKEILGLLGMSMLSMSIVEDKGGTDDKPDDKDDKAGGGGKDKEPTIEELQTKLKELGDSIAEKDKHIQRLDGIQGELRQTREQLREMKELQDKLKDKADDAGIEIPDDEYLVGKQIKELIKKIDDKYEKQRKDDFNLSRSIRAKERLEDDEDRMLNKKDLEIPFKEAMDKFLELVKEDETLFEQVNREANRPGGKPAQLAYKIALREHPELVNKIKQKSREEIVDKIARGEEMPRRLSGGGGGGKLDYSKMTNDELSKLSDAEFEALIKQ